MCSTTRFSTGYRPVKNYICLQTSQCKVPQQHTAVLVTDQWRITFLCKQNIVRCLNNILQYWLQTSEVLHLSANSTVQGASKTHCNTGYRPVKNCICLQTAQCKVPQQHTAVLLTDQWRITFVCKQHSARCLINTLHYWLPTSEAVHLSANKVQSASTQSSSVPIQIVIKV